MPLEVTVKNKVKGTEDLFQCEGPLTIEGKNCGTGKVLVKDLGDNQAELVLNNNVQLSELNGKTVTAYKSNTITDYEGTLKKGASLTFRGFGFSSQH